MGVTVTNEISWKISSLTLLLSDGGLNVYAEDPIMNEKMKLAAAKLNIKGHYVGVTENKKFLYAPTGNPSHVTFFFQRTFV